MPPGWGYLSMKRVILAEANNMAVKGMKMIFEVKFLDCQLDVTRNIADFRHMLELFTYDLAIIDLPGNDDIFQLVGGIHGRYPELSILVLSDQPEDLFARRLYKEGIKGYLQYWTGEDEIADAIKVLLRGETYVSENLRRLLLAREQRDHPFDRLSIREIQVLSLLMRARRPMEICAALKIKPSTASTHKRKIFQKLGISNTLELKALADKYGYPSS